VVIPLDRPGPPVSNLGLELELRLHPSHVGWLIDSVRNFSHIAANHYFT
jgi:hypothetical protein